ncbi:MAG: 50S ribosomal protein L20 [Patescibacteria group bacterium]
MRIKRGVVSHRKHKKILKAVKGFRMTKRRLIKVAKEAYLHSGQYAYAGRRKKKSDMRKLWINRISNCVQEYDISYSVFINKLKKANIILNRKILSDMIISDMNTFKALVDKIKNV